MLKPTSTVHKMNHQQIRAKIPSFARWIEEDLQQPLETVTGYDIDINYTSFLKQTPDTTWANLKNVQPIAIVTVNFTNREPATKQIKLMKNEEGAYVWDQEGEGTGDLEGR